MKRMTAWLLSILMIVSMLPTTALAGDIWSDIAGYHASQGNLNAAAGTLINKYTEEEAAAPVDTADTAATAADTTEYLFIATDRHANTSIIGNIVDNMESQINDTLDYLGLGGDMVGSGNTHPAYNSSTVLAEATNASNALSAENVDIVAGIHDMNVTDDAGIVLPYKNGSAQIYEGTNYYVYGVEEYCISEDSDATNWSSEAQKFVDWANGETIDKSKVIIVLSHYPLHAKRDDNDGAYYWHQALNTVATDAASGDSTVERDIVFFHGHNHTVDSNEYVYDVGDSMSIQNGSSTTSENIYYTYATAGYLNQNSKATLVTITDEKVVLEKYTTSGSGTAMAEVTRVVTETAPTTNTVTCEAGYLDTDGTTVVPNGDTVTATGLYLTGVSAVWNENVDISEFDFDSTAVYDVTLSDYSEGSEVTLVFDLYYMTKANLVVYSVGTDGALTPVEFTAEDKVSAEDSEVYYVSVTLTMSAASGTYIIGVPGVDNDAELVGISVTSQPEINKYTLKDITSDTTFYLDITGLTVTATYDNGQTEEIFWNQFEEETDGYALGSFDLTRIGTQSIAVTYGGFETSFDIVVYENNAKDVSTDETVAGTVEGMLKDGYAAYDFELDGYTQGDTVKVVMPAPENANAVFYVDTENNKLVRINTAEFKDGVVTFTTDHFTVYAAGEIELESDDAVVESTTSTTTKTVYVLTSSISSGNTYLIVNGNSAGSYYALANNSGSVAATGVTVQSGDVDGDGDTETYIELTDAADEQWTVGSGYTFQNGNYYLGYTTSGNGYNQSYTFGLSTTSRDWSYSTSYNRLSTSVTSGRDNTTYYLRYNNGWTWTSSNNSSTSGRSIYFYVPTEITVTTGTPGHTYSVEGIDTEAAAINGATINLSSKLYDTPTDTNVKTDITASSGLTPKYEVVTTKGNPAVITSITDGVATLSGTTGTAVVKVTYTIGTLTAWDEFTVTANAPDHYSIQLHLNNGGTLGEEITEPIALKNVKAGDTYSVWAVVKAYASADDATGTDLGTLGDALTWTVSNTSIATIDPTTGVITFTGEEFGTIDVTVSYTGEGGKTCTDTITISATSTNYIVPGDGTDDFPDYPYEGSVRFDKTATALGNFSETGIAKVELSMTGVPFTTGNELDVVLMLDMTGSMDDVSSSTSEPTGYVRIDATIASAKAFIRTIVKNEDGSYNKNRIGVYVFNKNGASTVYDLAVIDTDAKLEALVGKVGDSGEEFATDYTNGKLDTVWTDYGVSGGTPYDDGLEKCYSVLDAAKTDGIGNNRKQFTVFMTDGVPTSYAFVNGTTYGTHSSAGAVAGMLTSASDYATRDTDYKYEYYSTEMKKAGVTVYSVGVGLFNKNNAWSGSATQCGNLASALLNDISGPANETTQPDAVGTATLSKKDSYFFSVDDTDAGTEMAKIFKDIAVSILEAATDVVVEDKVGDKYSINFGLPGYGTSNALDSTALDGLSNFYIQVVDYVLDPTTHERTDEYTVLENFTFNLNGTLASHTVDGAACGDTCGHVTITDGEISAINGTYFDYKSDSTGEYLTWTAEKITTTELALQFFAYLDNSSGVSKDDQVDPGTYYTNEYATLTYTNFQNKRVQQEFPVPQMTWYGAQVSYVFYLVNDDGKPVNKAGREVPFTEAVYVTNVKTHAVVWNDLEQTAGLEAQYLADDEVPEIYALYDDDASYNIHVYADEEGANLNNHFIIGGDVTDNYNTDAKWTNAKTTYVFNTKADGTKYNTSGAYIANDGSDSTDTTAYLCKGNGTVSGVTWTNVTLTSDSDLVNAAYYYDVNGVKTRALTYVEGTTYYKLTGASYTTAEGETQWQPGTSDSTTGGTVINGYIYYVDDKGVVYTIVQKEDGTEVRKGFDFANTTVAFAVVWKPQLKEDVVVIDYGLDVKIDVITNDTMVVKAVGVRADAPTGVTINSGVYTADKATSADVMIGTTKIGTASTIEDNVTYILFSPDKEYGMQFSAPAVFYYEADVVYYDENGELQNNSMYSSVTVIPATTVYYEETFVKTTDSTGTSTVNADYGKWSTDGSLKNKTQSQDRPGDEGYDDIDPNLDANNIYGYDPAYDSMTTYSLGQAYKVTVDATTGSDSNGNTVPTASFTFTGRGFDVVSLTNSDSGLIVVVVKESGTENVVKNLFVINYFSYRYDNGAWVVDKDASSTLYQIPVMKVDGLAYGTYDVEIKVAYNSYFDYDKNDSGEANGEYSFWLDAIRIYDPVLDSVVVDDKGTTKTDDDVTVGNIYDADNELYPGYITIRDNLVELNTLNSTGSTTSTTIPGVVFIDGNSTATSITDYSGVGPNNETYLESKQGITFKLISYTDKMPKNYVHIGAKLSFGDKAIMNISDTKLKDGSDNEYVLSNTKSSTLTTATDMYYQLENITWSEFTFETEIESQTYTRQAFVSQIITISNGNEATGDIISLTNLKFIYDEAPTPTELTKKEAQETADPQSVEEAETTAYFGFAPVTVETLNTGVATMNALYATEPSFAPALLETSIKDNGDSTETLSIIASADVAKLTVDGEEITPLAYSEIDMSLISDLLSDAADELGIPRVLLSSKIKSGEYKVWQIPGETVGKIYQIKTTNEDNLESVTIYAPETEEDTDLILGGFVEFEHDATTANSGKVFVPEKMEVSVNRTPDGNETLVVSTSEDVDYIVVGDEVIENYITETVVDLSSDGAETVSRVWLASVDLVGEDVTAYKGE